MKGGEGRDGKMENEGQNEGVVCEERGKEGG